MIAVDTNLLVYAHRRDSDLHARTVEVLQELAGGIEVWAIPWPCLHEFLAIVTHPRIFDPPSTTEQAIDQLTVWRRAPGLTLLAESEGYTPVLERLLRASGATGPRVHDARVAALCLHHGVAELWTADRDFGRFPQLTTRNPLVR